MRFDPRVFELADAPALHELLPRLAGERGLVLFDSASGSPRRFSLLGFDPLRGLGVPASVTELARFVARVERVAGDSIPGPFQGGFVGELSYDIGPAGESSVLLPRDAWGTPLVVGGW